MRAQQRLDPLAQIGIGAAGFLQILLSRLRVVAVESRQEDRAFVHGKFPPALTESASLICAIGSGNSPNFFFTARPG
ncbi:MAG: hypothetical protein ACJ8F7_07745 [Gemmataceae bacterium]